MSDYARTIDKAIAELRYAKALGPLCAIEALIQARTQINLALDDARKQNAEQLAPIENPVAAQ